MDEGREPRALRLRLLQVLKEAVVSSGAQVPILGVQLLLYLPCAAAGRRGWAWLGHHCPAGLAPHEAPCSGESVPPDDRPHPQRPGGTLPHWREPRSLRPAAPTHQGRPGRMSAGAHLRSGWHHGGRAAGNRPGLHQRQSHGRTLHPQRKRTLSARQGEAAQQGSAVEVASGGHIQQLGVAGLTWPGEGWGRNQAPGWA